MSTAIILRVRSYMYTLGRAVLIISIAVGIVLSATSLVVSSVKKPETVVIQEGHTPEYQRALFEASRVYGRAGCGDQALAEMTARHAIDAGLPAQLIAAQVATESNCNPLAISNRGAIGLTQVTPRSWSKEFDFSRINLFNPDENMKVGSSILGRLVKQYGTRIALQRYYGLGKDETGLGSSNYADRVLSLAGKFNETNSVR